MQVHKLYRKFWTSFMLKAVKNSTTIKISWIYFQLKDLIPSCSQHSQQGEAVV